MITIYDVAGGARGMRVTWTCEEMALPYRVEPVGFPTDQRYRALNPFGTVPYLRDGDLGLSESIAMIVYLAQKYGPTELLPPPDDDRLAGVLEFALFGEASLCALMTPLLMARFAAPEAEKRSWCNEKVEAKLAATIGHLDARLGDRPFLVGPGLTLADISVVTALRIWTKGLGQTLPDGLQAYCDRIKDRPAYQRAAVAHAGPKDS